MLISLSCQDFKSLKDISFDFGRLNVLVGPNHSGKSAVLQSLALLKQSYLADASGFILEGPYVQLGTLQDVTFGSSSTGHVGLGLEFRVLDSARNMPWGGDRLTYKVDSDGQGLSQQVGMDGKDEFLILPTGEVDWGHPPTRTGFNATPSRIGRWGPFGVVNDKMQIVQSVESEIQRQLEGIFVLGPLRGVTQTSTPIERDLFREVGSRGEHLVSVLHFVQGDQNYAEQTLKIRSWAEKFGLKGLFARLTPNDTNTLSFIDPEIGNSVIIANSGFGANHLLPVIAQCFLAPKGSTILIEEPEAHLHPAYQALLVDLFIDVMNFGNQVIMTTHSENLLLRILTRVAQKKIMPNDLKLYALQKLPTGSVRTEIPLDQKGLLQKIPAGFFEEGLNEALEHVKAASGGPERDEKT